MVTVKVNGQERSFDGDASMPLLWFLRDELGLTGTKFGCGVALCGACTVHLDGEAVRACGVAMSDVGGKSVTTIEGCIPPANIRSRSPGACQRPAMRLLSMRPDHAGRGASCEDPCTYRQADRRRHVRQHLPLRLLSAHPHRGPRGFEGGVT